MLWGSDRIGMRRLDALIRWLPPSSALVTFLSMPATPGQPAPTARPRSSNRPGGIKELHSFMKHVKSVR